MRLLLELPDLESEARPVRLVAFVLMPTGRMVGQVVADVPTLEDGLKWCQRARVAVAQQQERRARWLARTATS